MTMSNYQRQLFAKHQQLHALLRPFSAPKIRIYPSPEKHYRMRAEFRIWRDDEQLFYAMSRGGALTAQNIVRLHNFPPAYITIDRCMPLLLDALRADPVLHHKLYEVHFLACLRGELLVSLIYHRALTDEWTAAAKALAKRFHILLIGRSRKQKITLERDFILETLNVDGRAFHYHQYEQSFSQPNAYVCQKMLRWACAQAGENAGDLLELYCGNGNFTLPLASHFRRVLATEISKSSITALQENIFLNQTNNIAVARLSAEEFTQAWQKERDFYRLKQAGIELADYQFETVFVDPPRAGIDDNTLFLLQKFPKIIYISCNPHTLAANLQTLTQTHELCAAALFDQFPDTPHIECGVVLRKK